jgi:hypothetical protein
MLFQKPLDYTTMSLGTKIRKGAIETCPQCGKRGVYIHVTYPTPDSTIEKWIHYDVPGRGLMRSEKACIRTTMPINGVLTVGWNVRPYLPAGLSQQVGSGK